MAKGHKVKYDEGDDDSEYEKENESDSDDDEFSNEQLVDMLQQAD